MEYQATVTIKRAARGEGDEPLVIVAASGTAHEGYNYPADDAMLKALEEANVLVRSILDRKAGRSEDD